MLRHWAWLALLLLAGFWARLTFWSSNVYHTDEFITMLAARMVAQRGLPILPSGLFYDHGLLYSFLSGTFVALLGFDEQVARWPSVLVSVLTIAAYYAAARRLFASSLVGVLAAALATLNAYAIEWGAWARMYGLAHLFVLLAITWLLLGTLEQPSARRRYLGLVFLAGALLSHTVTFFLLPPLAILLLVFTLVYRRDWLRDAQVGRQAVLAAGIIGLVLLVISTGHVGSTVSLQDPNAAASAPLGLDFLQGFFQIEFSQARVERLTQFFQAPAYQGLLYLIGLALLVSLLRLWRRRAGFNDIIFLFLALFSALVVLELAVLLTTSWQKSRYLFILILPAFLLLSASSLGRLLGWLAGQALRLTGQSLMRRRSAEWLATGIGIGLVAWLWGGAAWDVTRRRGTGDFDLAFAYVRESWRPGDRVMSEHPAAAYLYLGQNDYYANQVSAKVLDEDAEDERPPVDRYVGSSLVDSADSFNRVLASSPRTWFVVDQGHLIRRYDDFFRQQVFAQMDAIYQAGTKLVFLSHSYPMPVPAEPTTSLSGNFSNVIVLEGYSLPASMAPDGSLPLGLYWRPISAPPSRPFKVFVQLRNGLGETIAQADHFIYEGLLDVRQWDHTLAEPGAWLRDTADLAIPLPFSPGEGPYRLYVGFYDPQMLQRLPLVNDTSGENAVVVELPALPEYLPPVSP